MLRHPGAWGLVLVLSFGRATDAAETIEPALHRLGSVHQPEWQEFVENPPEGPRLTIHFRSAARQNEATLFLRQRDVRLDWPVRLNGRPIGRLDPDEADLVHPLPIPPGLLKDGDNTLEIGPSTGVDDIVVGEIRLEPVPLETALGRSRLRLKLTDRSSGQPIPGRFTIADERGVLVPFRIDPSPKVAARTGVLYSALDEVRVRLAPGRYVVYGTRGFEYGMDSRELTLADDEERSIALAIEREVPTPGLIACDTHVHTGTHSGHGDANVEERLVTIAGEGIELPVATDHNRLSDDRETAARLGLAGFFTPIIGDEVTTRRGHFNVFPFRAGESAPDPTVEPWPELMRALRKGSPDRVVVLNHPRDVHSGYRPFGPENFNPAVGENREGIPFEFDGLEVINSGALQSDPSLVLNDWFALWNHGQQATAVGASDSHDVSRSIVGQARTYIVGHDEDPGRIDVNEACRNLREGRALVSFGLLTRLEVDGRFGPGDLAAKLGDTLRVVAVVLGPSWTQADRVELFANGIKIREHRIDAGAPRVEKARVEWLLPRPPHDVALVAVASGPGITAPYWPTPRPYQPTSRAWTPRLLGLSNPIRIDGDGDGSWSSPRYYAQFVIEIFGTEPTTLFRMLSRYDQAVATQAAAFCLPHGAEARDAELLRQARSAPESVRKGFEAFEQALPKDQQPGESGP